MNKVEPSTFEFETARLRLRPLNESDEKLYRDLYTDPEIMRFIAPPLSLEQAAASFRKAVVLQSVQTLTSRFLVMQEKATRQFVGICGTATHAVDGLRVEVGIVLKAGACLRGLAREALIGLTTCIFAISDVVEIRAQFASENLAAFNLFRGLNFSPCGDLSKCEGEVGGKLTWSLRR